MRKLNLSKPTLVGLVAFGVFVVGATYWWLDYRMYVTTDDAYLHSDIAPIAPKVAGYVDRIEVTDHQFVHKGDVLVRLVDNEYAAQVRQAEASVAARTAALENVARRTELQKAIVNEAVAGADASGAELKRSRLDSARVDSLVKNAYMSRQRSETADADLGKARAGAQSAAARIEAEKAQLAVLDTERAEDEAAIAEAKALLDLANMQFRRTVIRAPSDGIVGNRAVVPGQYLRIGAVIMSIVPMDNVWVEANFKETQLTRMQVGQPATVRLDAYPGIEVTGRVESMAPASGALFSLLPPENASGNFTKVVQRVPVKIVLPADNALAGRLRPGLSAVISVNTHPGAEKIAVAGLPPLSTNGVMGAAPPAPPATAAASAPDATSPTN
jgi:membrane fusion protein (multidrug efflux system)